MIYPFESMGIRLVNIVGTVGIAALVAACASPLGVPVGAVTTVAEDRPVREAGSDLRIKTNILTTFAEQAKGLLVDVNTDVYEGQVLLTGSVKKPEDRAKAEAIVRGINGVRQVFNDIQVTEEGGFRASAKDFAIETKLKANLLTASGVTSINYRWRAVNGVVYLLGLARSQEELDKVLGITRQMDGVRDVVSHVFIKPPPSS
jgi:osmotically-inducible protein OsmY